MNYYVTTSIPYVNGEPHIGHAMEFVMADVLARTARAEGKPVIFSTGTDEHGGKVAEKAAELKLQPKQFADQISMQFRNLCKELKISNDRFVRTTDPGHEQRAQIIWQNMAKNSGLLPQVTFSILFALALKPRHGYELMQQIEHDTTGRVRLGPGALYGTIKQLREDNLIEEVPSELANDRRRYYRLTRRGWKTLSAELAYFDNTVRLAKQRRLIGTDFVI